MQINNNQIIDRHSHPNEQPVFTLLTNTKKLIQSFYSPTHTLPSLTILHNKVAHVVVTWGIYARTDVDFLKHSPSWRKLMRSAMPKLLTAYFIRMILKTNELRSRRDTGTVLREGSECSISVIYREVARAVHSPFPLSPRFASPIIATIDILGENKVFDVVAGLAILRIFHEALNYKEYRSEMHLARVAEKNLENAAKLALTNRLPESLPQTTTPTCIEHNHYQMGTLCISAARIQSLPIGFRASPDDLYSVFDWDLGEMGTLTYCAVFDGWGEPGASSYLKGRMPILIGTLLEEVRQQLQNLWQNQALASLIEDPDQQRAFLEALEPQKKRLEIPVVLANVITQACINANKSIHSIMPSSGSSAVISLILGNHLVTGCVGSSEACFGWYRGQALRGVRLAPPADPTNGYFADKIHLMGGSTSNRPPLAGSLGGYRYPMVSRPLISYIDLSPLDSSVLILATGGFWTDVTFSAAISEAMHTTYPPAFRLAQLAQERGITDHTTVITVRIRGKA